MQAGSAECWCFDAEIPADVLARVPEAARDRACVCRNCAAGKANPAETQRKLEKLLRGRG